MLKKYAHAFLVGILSGSLITGCTAMPTIKKPEYKSFLMGKSISDQELERIKEQSPKDAVFADLLQAYALLRTGKIDDPSIRKKALSLLQSSVNSFEDMTDPVNAQKAFFADENKNFRGRPHERMAASAMAGVLLMGDNKCNEALPYFRNAEFLDARFQKMPFGTDAPLIYALMYRCLLDQKSDAASLKHAEEGVFKSIRFLSWQEPLIEALQALDKADIRPMAIANRLAYLLFEISIYHSLLTAPNTIGVVDLIDDAAKNSELFIASLDSNFEDDYKKYLEPAIKELKDVYPLDKKSGLNYLKEFAIQKMAHDASKISAHMKKLARHHADFRHKIDKATSHSHELTAKILKAAHSEKLILNFSGLGPSLVREGSYDEISVIKPGPDANISPTVRERSIKTDTSCGFHRTENGGFSVVMCKNPSLTNESTRYEMLDSVELLSVSRKATTVMGRKFDKVLKGRAQFRAATEDIATVSAWSAFFLFYMGSKIMSDCSRRGGNQSCYAPAYALWAIAGITVIFSGTIWLVGRSQNPAADSRYIHLMYESAWLAI